jgi:di/tricarboxylate transporter
VVLMVAGMSTLVSIAERTGGLKLFSQWLASTASADTANGMIAFVTGVISIFSSTSGVVLPTFLPMVPELASGIPGTDPLSLAMSVNIGSNLVDVSPVSTIGALCLAALPSAAGRERLFRQMLLWGGSMSVVAAVVCQSML